MKKLILLLTIPLLAVTAFGANKVTVTNAYEFLKAIDDNTTICIPAEVSINLSDVLEDPQALYEALGQKSPLHTDHEFGTWSLDSNGPLRRLDKGLYLNNRFDGNMLIIKGYKNLTITGPVGDYREARGWIDPTILVRPRYADVLAFLDCSNIKLCHLTLGHTDEGYCQGAVLGFASCSKVDIDACDLYGCGIVGIEAVDVNGLTVTGTRIHDCADGLVDINESKNVLFDLCLFDHSPAGIRIDAQPSVIRRSVICYNRPSEELFCVSGARMEGCLISQQCPYIDGSFFPYQGIQCQTINEDGLSYILFNDSDDRLCCKQIIDKLRWGDTGILENRYLDMEIRDSSAR
ncbi:MAG: right-handed parallel beta-helix repeat-containing protein [Bacteroidales bacterium]|nr:right-handed parallel beta-helix repeat-containing protein [Bacteroidales bacterium]